VNFTISGTAEVESDFQYSPESNELDFSTDSQQAITIFIVDDSIQERSETLQITLETPCGTSLSISISDNDLAEFSMSDVVVDELELDSLMRFTLESNLLIAYPILFEISLSDREAKFAEDFLPVLSESAEFEIEFPPLSTSYEIDIVILEDNLVEPDLERFSLTFVCVSESLFGEAQGSIRDLDFSNITIDNASGTESSSDEQNSLMRFLIHLSNPVSQNVHLLWQVEYENASQADIFPSAGSIIIQPKELFGEILIEILDDSIVETSEEFIVRISFSPPLINRVSIQRSTATGIIFDDDLPSSSPSSSRTRSSSPSSSGSPSISESSSSGASATSSVTPSISRSPSPTFVISNGNILPPEAFPSEIPEFSHSETTSPVRSPSSSSSISVLDENQNENNENNQNEQPNGCFEDWCNFTEDEPPTITFVSTESITDVPVEVLGVTVGVISVPPGQGVQLIYQPISSESLSVENLSTQDGNLQSVNSALVDLQLFTESGEELNRFTKPISICLKPIRDDGSNVLAFFNEERNLWEVVDEDLTTNSAGLLCGETLHFTLFALLLGDPTQGSSSENTLYPYVVAFGGTAIVIVFISVILIEIKVRRRHLQLSSELRRIEQLS